MNNRFGCPRAVAAAVSLFFTVAFALSAAVPEAAAQLIPDRRREQFLSDPAHLFAPLPYSLPGIGTGLFLLGNFSNVFESPTDIFLVGITGDAAGFIGVVDEMPLLSRHLLLQAYNQNITKGAINSYRKRGMDSDKDDFDVIELSSVKGNFFQLNLNFYERRLEFLGGVQMQSQEIKAIRDADGTVISEFEEPIKGESEGNTLGLRLDFTDDRQDPRTGFRLRLFRSNSLQDDLDEADFYTLDYGALFYVPVGDTSTWVFHYFQSDAVVRRQGNTDRQIVLDQLEPCAAGDTECEEAQTAFVDNAVAGRTFGTATPLGGQERLRSYPGGRFQGAHSAFFGTELRWNLRDEATPFNFFIWKDVRTAVQFAFFAETGTVADASGDLWDDSRQSYGAAVRLISRAGNVYKAEFAIGDEGGELILFFFYPWD